MSHPRDITEPVTSEPADMEDMVFRPGVEEGLQRAIMLGVHSAPTLRVAIYYIRDLEAEVVRLRAIRDRTGGSE